MFLNSCVHMIAFESSLIFLYTHRLERDAFLVYSQGKKLALPGIDNLCSNMLTVLQVMFTSQNSPDSKHYFFARMHWAPGCVIYAIRYLLQKRLIVTTGCSKFYADLSHTVPPLTYSMKDHDFVCPSPRRSCIGK